MLHRRAALSLVAGAGLAAGFPGGARRAVAATDAPALPRIGRPEALYHPSFTAGNFGVFAHVPRDRYDAVRNILTESGSEEVLVEQS